MRPGTFGLLAQAGPLSPSPDVLPAAPYDDRSSAWVGLDWYDRSSGWAIRVTTASPASDPVAFQRDLERGDVPIRTLGDVLGGYDRRVEHKSIAPDGGPVTSTTRGSFGGGPCARLPRSRTWLARRETASRSEASGWSPTRPSTKPNSDAARTHGSRSCSRSCAGWAPLRWRVVRTHGGYGRSRGTSQARIGRIRVGRPRLVEHAWTGPRGKVRADTRCCDLFDATWLDASLTSRSARPGGWCPSVTGLVHTRDRWTASCPGSGRA